MCEAQCYKGSMRVIIRKKARKGIGKGEEEVGITGSVRVPSGLAIIVECCG